MCDCWFFVQNVLVDDLFENALGIGLDLSFDTNNQVVKLVETLFFEMSLQRELFQIFKDLLNEFSGVLADNVTSGFTWGRQASVEEPGAVPTSKVVPLSTKSRCVCLLGPACHVGGACAHGHDPRRPAGQ